MHKKASQFLRILIGRQLTNEQLNKRKYFKLYIYRVVCLSTYLCRRKLSVRYELSRQVGVGCESVVRGMNWVTNTRILADYEACHVTYPLKVSSKYLQSWLEIISPTERLAIKPDSDSGSGIGWPAKLRPYGAAVRPDIYQCAEVSLQSAFEPDICERHTFAEHKKHIQLQSY